MSGVSYGKRALQHAQEEAHAAPKSGNEGASGTFETPWLPRRVAAGRSKPRLAGAALHDVLHRTETACPCSPCARTRAFQSIMSSYFVLHWVCLVCDNSLYRHSHLPTEIPIGLRTRASGRHRSCTCDRCQNLGRKPMRTRRSATPSHSAVARPATGIFFGDKTPSTALSCATRRSRPSESSVNARSLRQLTSRAKRGSRPEGRGTSPPPGSPFVAAATDARVTSGVAHSALVVSSSTGPLPYTGSIAGAGASIALC